MTFEEMEKSLKELAAQMRHIEDAQIVQGVLERRLEDRLETLAASAEATDRATERLLQVVKAHEERLVGVEDRLVGVEDRHAEMQAALRTLIETVNRFISGQGTDGHKQENA